MKVTLAQKNSRRQMLNAALFNWFAANARDLPWRRTRDPYAIWVSEIMHFFTIRQVNWGFGVSE